jgi:hypothetical protein
MNKHTIVKRIGGELESADYNWLISSFEPLLSTTVEQESVIRCSITIRNKTLAYLYGRFEIDIAAALKAGLIDRALRCEKPRLRIEYVDHRLYLKRAGNQAPFVELPAESNILRVDMRNAYRWGFNRKSA